MEQILAPDRRCCHNFWTEEWAETGRPLKRGNFTGLKEAVKALRKWRKMLKAAGKET